MEKELEVIDVLMKELLEFAASLVGKRVTDPSVLHEAHALVIQAAEIAEWGIEEGNSGAD